MNKSSNKDIPFLITIDTEGDNLWAKQEKVSTENAKYLERFQALCEKYAFIPSYLINYEMAKDTTFIMMAKKALNQGKCEIGTHLHAWNSPPEYQISSEDYKTHPFLINYPLEIMEQKLQYITYLLQDTFGKQPIIHRAGRWAINEQYVRLLKKYGYKVDCSVTPHIDWSTISLGGVNYRYQLEEPFYIQVDDSIEKDKYNQILELPVTIIEKKLWNIDFSASEFISKVANRCGLSGVFWFRPNGHNISQMKKIVDMSILDCRPYIQFMIHSSELMPGCSPIFTTHKSIEKLYRDLDFLFAYMKDRNFVGMSLESFANLYKSMITMTHTL